MDRQKVILRCLDGRVIRGYIDDFSASDERVAVEDESSARQEIGVEELKAIFFVRTFEGNRSYAEKKSFLEQVSLGKRVFVKFKDGECMTGYIEGGVPWKRGFFLEPKKGAGFFLLPVDNESNNIKVFVVASSVWDVTVMG
jgi:small nuclear ribonucleoprotein (snRNP)-like protein